MEISDRGRAFIESYEGLFLAAYDDATDCIVQPGGRVRGTLTIGYGHTTAAGTPHVFVGQVITKVQADEILCADLLAVEAEINTVIKVPLTQNQADALGSFQFNTGWLTHPHCTLTAALNAGHYDLAAADFALYDRASGRLIRGLVKRRYAEHEMFMANSYVAADGTLIA